MDKKWLLSTCSPPGPHPSLSVPLSKSLGVSGTLPAPGDGPERHTGNRAGYTAPLPASGQGFSGSMNPQFPLPSGSPVPTVPTFLALKMGQVVLASFCVYLWASQPLIRSLHPQLCIKPSFLKLLEPSSESCTSLILAEPLISRFIQNS